MPISPKSTRSGPAFIILVLVAVTSLVWCWQNGRLTPRSWSVPLNYVGDSLEILARFKAVTEGEELPFVPERFARLGAPSGADWSEYPVSDKPLILILGNIARWIGVNQTSNLAVLLAHITSVLAFFGCARFLRARAPWAFAGAILFGFTYQITSRGLPHLWLAFAYTVPCAITVCWLVGASRRIRATSKWAFFCYATAVVIGFSNPYNLFFFLQLLTLSIIAQIAGARRGENVKVGCISIGLGVLFFFAFQAPAWIYPANEGANALMVRNYGGTELYALKPIELFVTPNTHHVGFLADLGNRYFRWSDIKGEIFMPYLGIIGVVGLLCIFADLVFRLARRRSHKLPAYGLQICWILLYSGVGGFNSLLSFFTPIHIFRATNRFSIFIAAIVFFFLVQAATRMTRTWSRSASWVLAAVVIIIGLYDQLPLRNFSDQPEIAARVSADQSFGMALENKFSAGTAVFELPLLDFPEGKPLYRFADYEHFRPYLVTHTLKFSYGGLKGRAPVQWMRDYGELAPKELVPYLEKFGFGALLVNRRGYADRADSLIKELQDAGYNNWIEDEQHELSVLKLKPVHPAHPPLAKSLTFGDGWNPLESDATDAVRWTNGDASISYYNPYAEGIELGLDFVVQGIRTTEFRFLLDGRLIHSAAIGVAPTQIHIPTLHLGPGSHHIEFISTEPGVRVSEKRSSLRALGIKNLQFKVESPYGEVAQAR